MSRLSTIPKDEKLYTKLKYAFSKYDESFDLPRGTCRKNITNKLGFKTVKEFNNYLDLYENKFLRIEELFIIISCLDSEQQKLILDYLSQKYDFICNYSAVTDPTINNTLENILLNLSATNGSLIKNFLDAIQDKNINEYEKEALKDIAYNLRTLLVNFESRINEFDND